MIRFDDIPFSPKMSQALSKLKINYVFQSIFYPDGKTIYAREALMRPDDKTVTELIDEYTYRKELYVLEVATLFGSLIEYNKRRYSELISINSFPCEFFTDEDSKTFFGYFEGQKIPSCIVETLEYPVFDHVASAYKRKQTSQFNNLLALDDFGSGLNTCEIAEFMKPDIIKLDRSLLTGIDSNKEKQANCDNIISAAHNHGVKIVAEGIETKAEFECMKQLGSDFFQGYYLGMPI